VPWPERILGIDVETACGPLEIHSTHIPLGVTNGWIKIQMLEGLYAGLAHPKHLRGLEYFHVPRGWVLFDKTQHRFQCYLDKRLCTVTIKRVIMAHFHLPCTKTIFQPDLYYTTDPNELDQLFSR
jgi:hypothetical protein